MSPVTQRRKRAKKRRRRVFTRESAMKKRGFSLPLLSLLHQHWQQRQQHQLQGQSISLPASSKPLASPPSPPKYNREQATGLGPYLVSQDPPHFLSAVSVSDIPEMVRILNLDDFVFRNSAYFKFPYPEDLARAHVARADRVIETRGVNAHWAMRTSPEGKIIGWLSLHPVKPTPCSMSTTTTMADVLEAALLPNNKSTPAPENDTEPKIGSELNLKLGRIGYWVSPEYRNQVPVSHD